MARPKRIAYRDPRKPGRGKRLRPKYHDGNGTPVYSDARIRPLKLPFTVHADEPSIRCGGTNADGSPCQRWACIESKPPRCHSHGGHRTKRRRPCHVADCPLFAVRPYHRHGSKGYFHGELLECLGIGNKSGIIMVAPRPKVELDWKGMPLDHSRW